MPVRRTKRPFIIRAVAPCAAVAILGYFGFHAFSGKYGIRAHIAIKHEIALAQSDLDGLTRRKDHLAKRVAMLRDGSMEFDMVDQFARDRLSLVRSDEIVVLTD